MMLMDQTQFHVNMMSFASALTLNEYNHLLRCAYLSCVIQKMRLSSPSIVNHCLQIIKDRSVHGHAKFGYII